MNASYVDPLARFSPAVRGWFAGAFPAPTPAQAGSWDAISGGGDTLVIAPTGSGKTLAAFLWALDGLVRAALDPEAGPRCKVVYVSPMKALGVDVERNLRAPLVGIGLQARDAGLPVRDVRVAVRTGDTPPNERRAFATDPADILITTPESLFLLLTSQARASLAGVQTVIVDEIHAVAGTKRGAHLALTLERLDALLQRPAQRIGLSATVRPVEEVARFLGGGRPVRVVDPPAEKRWDLRVVVPVPDLADLGVPSGDLAGPASGEPARTSIWPHVEERMVDEIAAHRSTLVFANSRRLAERLTARLNEIWEDRLAAADAEEASASADGAAAPRAAPRSPPAAIIGGSGTNRGAPPVLARAHHGSVSKEQRAAIEDDLKAGLLPAVVATSSLEVGIDMGAVDLVIQVEAPPSVASGVQRVGRAGHQVGAVSRGLVFPKHRADLVQSAIVVERMRAGAIEALRVPANPLDVLAQHLVAMTALDEWSVEEVHALVRRAAPYASLTRPVLESVLDMLAGRYPSEEFAELRPRLVWDRVTDTLTGRPGAQRLAVTSGGTIPDRGLFGVFLAGEGAGRRVGELDEEMVYESRVGDVFTLGTSSWLVEDISHDRVTVSPAPGRPGRLPFWRGDTLGRSPELGAALGAYVRELTQLPRAEALRRARDGGLDDWAADNLLDYLIEQRDATGELPDERTIVVERFRDELGDWQIAVHSPHGTAVHAPWALVVAARLRERLGVEVHPMHADDGIVLHLPDADLDPEGSGGSSLADVVADLVIDPAEVAEAVTRQLGGSALFAARFRECAARALLLPRRVPGRRQALWQQRQRAAQLLSVASRYPSFPIVLEAVRECLQDVFDVPALTELMRDIAARRVRVVAVDTPSASPFARSLLFGYVGQFLYEGDAPLAERRAAALSLDPDLLAELLGGTDAADLADLLDPAVVVRTEAELQRLAPDRRCRTLEDVADLVRRLGPIDTASVRARSDEQVAEQVGPWLDQLRADRRLLAVRVAGHERWAVVEDAARLRDALGVGLPPGVPEALLRPVSDPLADLAVRYARTRGPFQARDLARWLGIGLWVAQDALTRLAGEGRLARGRLRPPEANEPEAREPRDPESRDPQSRCPESPHLKSHEPHALPAGGDGAGGDGTRHALDYCDPDVLRLLRRRSLAALRAEVEPVEQRDLARFLPRWQGVGGASRGVDGVASAIEQLAGAVLPASAWETLVLPARIRDYSPADLDELLSSGEVLWQGHGALPGRDGWVSFHLADSAPLTLAPFEGMDGNASESIESRPVDGASDARTDLRRALLAILGTGGAFHARALAERCDQADTAAVVETLWSLAWEGVVTHDTFASLRALTGSGGTRRPRTAGRRGGRRLRPYGSVLGRPPSGGVLGSPRMAQPEQAGSLGRWSLLPSAEVDPTLRAHAAAELLLDRHGVLTRGAVAAEEIPGGFAAVYRVLAAAEEAGRVRRGYFVEGLGASQFGSTGAVDRLRASRREPDPFAATAVEPPATSPGTGRRTSAYGASAGRSPGEGPAAVLLAATDPANPYGAALAWPSRHCKDGGTEHADDPTAAAREPEAGHRPGRKAGALVVLRDGELVLYVERGGRTVLTYTTDLEALYAAAESLVAAVSEGRLRAVTIERVDGAAILGAPHPLRAALEDAGFHTTPRGLRMRR